MKLTRLAVSSFRNITRADIRPNPGFNVIHGPNGSGKTSLLEAVSYLALGRSFRGLNYHYLIQKGAESFDIFATVDEGDNLPELSLGVKRTRHSNREIKINADKVGSLLEIIAHVCIQIIHPQGIDLVTGGPEHRRSFLDWGVFYQYSDFKKLFFDYRRALMNRNRLLKTGAPDEQFLPWDKILSELSIKINNLRKDYLEDLRLQLEQDLRAFLPGIKFDFQLTTGFPKEISPFAALHDFLERDRTMGFTNSGCHRADLKIKADGLLASSILSRGQLKLLVCAMRISQVSSLLKNTGRSCIVLVDDLNSELDINSQHVLIQKLMQYDSQVFITRIDPEIPTEITKPTSIFKIDDGKIQQI